MARWPNLHFEQCMFVQVKSPRDAWLASGPLRSDWPSPRNHARVWTASMCTRGDRQHAWGVRQLVLKFYSQQPCISHMSGFGYSSPFSNHLDPPKKKTILSASSIFWWRRRNLTIAKVAILGSRGIGASLPEHIALRFGSDKKVSKFWLPLLSQRFHHPLGQ